MCKNIFHFISLIPNVLTVVLTNWNLSLLFVYYKKNTEIQCCWKKKIDISELFVI